MLFPHLNVCFSLLNKIIEEVSCEICLIKQEEVMNRQGMRCDVLMYYYVACFIFWGGAVTLMQCPWLSTQWYSFCQPWKDDRLSEPDLVLIQCSPGLNSRPADLKQSTLTIQPTPGLCWSRSPYNFIHIRKPHPKWYNVWRYLQRVVWKPLRLRNKSMTWTVYCVQGYKGVVHPGNGTVGERAVILGWHKR